MKKKLAILKSPFFLFVFFGVVLYFSYTKISSSITKKNKTIVVDAMQFEIQKELYTKTWNRPPNDEQLQKQIDNIVMDEIFYREGVALGLDKSDLAIKRRLRQMVELMLEDFTTVTPNENQLRTFLNENPEKFITDYTLSFEHLYFKQDELTEAEQFLTKLQADNSLALNHTGRLSMIPSEFINESTREVSKYLGTAFTQIIVTTDSQEWFGPVASPFGYHLVKIQDKTPGEVPDLNLIWDEVEREWSNKHKQEMKKEHYRKLREQYVIVYEKDEKTN